MTAVPISRTSALGWIIVAVLFLCTASLMGTSIYGFVLIADSMAKAHGWSDMAAGGLVSAMWLIAPLALFSAPVIARCGAWRLIVAGLLVLALAFAGLAVATEFWQVYTLRVLMGLGKVSIMTAMPVVVARWFDQRFGTAISIVWAGGSAGGILVAPLVEHLDRTMGFEKTALALAGGIALVALVAAIAARAKAPGLAAGSPTSAVDENAAGETSRGRLGAMLVCAIILATAALGCANVAVIAMTPQLFSGFGFDSQTVALIVSANAAAAMVGSLAIGGLTDRFGLGWPGFAVGGASLAGMAALLVLNAGPVAPLGFLAAMCAGLGGGAAEVLWISLLRREASGQRFSAAYGAWYFALQAGYAIGGLVGGWSLTQLGSVGFVLIAAAAFAATPIFSAWRSIHWSR